MKRIGMGLVGPGFVAAHHIDAVRRLGDVDVVAIAGSSQTSAEKKAREYKVDRAYGDFRELIADPDIHVIHNTTPNYLHLPVTMAIVAAGKHVISDKPLAMNSVDGKQMRDAALAAGVAHVVTFNYRGNPLVQHARGMVAKGEVGDVSFVHGYYLQDWMTDPNVYSWRADPAKGGSTSALGDIGSHWCDLAEHVSGLKIHSVLADLTTVIPVRYTTGASGEAFSGTSSGER
jgi:predicted dehydrogenase